MEYRFVFVVAILFFCGVSCEDVKTVESTSTETAENATKATATDFSTRKGRSSDMVYAQLVSCAVRYDTACLVGAAEDFLDIKRHELLAQADAQVSRASGRSDPENSPSHLATTIEKLLSELSGFFKNGLSGLFSGREAEDDDEIADADANSVDDEDEDKNKDGRDVGESRLLDKKKKKKKGGLKRLVKLIKVGILAGVVIIKIALLIKIFEAALKFKLLLVGVTSLILQIVKFWIDFKNRKNDHHDHDEGVLYKNPYESGLGGGEWAGPGASGGDYHARSDADTQSYAQNLAYSKYARK